MKRYLAPLLFACSLPVFAQGTSAEITGTVTDPTGAVVPSAVVTITNTQINAERALVTNSSGIHDAPSFQPGIYSVKVTSQGFRTDLRNGVEMQVGQVARLDFQLQVRNIADTVEVQSRAATLDTETSSVGTVIVASQQLLSRAPGSDLC